MKIIELNTKVKCDIALCDNDAKFELNLNSYKDNLYLCENCFMQLKNIIKRTQNKNEKE